MKNVLRAVSGLFGLLFLVSAIRWIVDPAAAAEGLGMPLLDGIGRSTQIGDIGAFFALAAALILAGTLRENATLLRTAGLLLASAAVLRTIAWMAHGAPPATADGSSSFFSSSAACPPRRTINRDCSAS